MTTTEFNQQISTLESYIFGFAMKLTCNREDAKDLYQETVLRAFNCKDRFTSGTNFKAWATTIMRNCFINEYRKRRTYNNVMQPLETSSEAVMKQAVTNAGPTIIMMKELREMLDILGDAHLVPFEMFTNGYDYQEIADQLNLPMGTVKSRIFFARKKMMKMITCNYGPAYFRRA